MRHWAWQDLRVRPLLFPVLALGVGAAIPPLATPAALLAAFVSGGLAAWVWWRRAGRGVRQGLLLACLVAGASLAAQAARASELPVGRPTLLEGRVEVVDHDAHATRAVLQVATADGRPVRARTRLWWSEPELRLWAGQRIRVQAELREDAGPDSWGEFDRGAAARSRGLRTAGRAVPGSCIPLSPAAGWRVWLESHRLAFGAAIRAQLANVDAAALLAALGAGLRSELGPGWEERFARSGLAHVLSVSGLHVAALALALATLLGAVLRLVPACMRRLDPRRPAALAALPLVWGYVLFTGQQAPAIRSAWMLTAVLMGRALQKPVDALNALALAAGVLLIADPASVRELSLQLSFTAVAALILLSPKLRRALPVPPPDPLRARGWPLALQRLREIVLGTVAASAAVTLASVPLVAGAFHRVSVAGLLANVIALPLCGLLTLAGAGAAGAFCIHPVLAAVPLWIGAQLAALLLRLVAFGSAIPGATFALPSFGPVATLAWCAGLLGLALGWRWIPWLAPAALASVVAGPAFAPRPPLEVTFLPVGHGDAILVSSAGRHLLVDGGGVPGGADPGARIVLPYLRERGVRRLDAVALSHPHPDHALGLITVLSEVPTDALWLPAGIGSGPLVRALVAAAGRAPVEELTAGRVLQLGASTVRVLSPPRGVAELRSVNDRSLVLQVVSLGRSVLLPGDLEAAGEAQLPATAATVVKVPHHGSRTSSTPDFVAGTHPALAVFSDGRHNRFGLPAPEVVDRWRATGAEVLRTDLDGAIRFEADAAGVRWETFRGRRGPLPASALASRPLKGAALPPMTPEDLDLAALRDDLHRALGPGEPIGYLRGKARMRDVLVDLHGFSQLEAESVVDTLELQGYVHFLGDPRAPSEAESRWEFRSP
jgi:competence protein ComEC